MPTFDSLWLELEPLINRDRRARAKAILAIAYGYREDRDNPPPDDKRRADRTLDAEKSLAYCPTPQEIAQAAAKIQKRWSRSDELHRRGLVEEPPLELPTAKDRDNRKHSHRSNAT